MKARARALAFALASSATEDLAWAGDGHRTIAAIATKLLWNCPHYGANGTGFFVDPKEQLVVTFGTAAPGEMRKYYREQVQDIVYGAMVK